MFLILFISEKVKNRFTEILTVYGKVPLFYFIVHLFIIHSIMFLMLRLQGFGSNDLLFGAFNNGRPKAGGGVDLPVIYLIWLCFCIRYVNGMAATSQSTRRKNFSDICKIFIHVDLLVLF
jgi:hypothetical protein